jgi:PilZ domain/Putative zinc-finger
MRHDEASDIESEVVTSGERRREPRYPCNDPVEIRRIPEDFTPLPATVLDVSLSGLRVALDTNFGQGSRVEVVSPKQVVIFGEVRYCRRAGERFHAGILIGDVFYFTDAGHIDDEQLSLYLAGNGLSFREVIALQQHLQRCRSCSGRLDEAKARHDREP